LTSGGFRVVSDTLVLITLKQQKVLLTASWPKIWGVQIFVDTIYSNTVIAGGLHTKCIIRCGTVLSLHS